MKKRENLILARGNNTQEEIAAKCGVKQQTYSHWEMGRATPSIKKMIILERVLGVPKETLFFDLFNSSNELNQPTGGDAA
jgi:transcriptional regulator with XRE-family HTH domain